MTLPRDLARLAAGRRRRGQRLAGGLLGLTRRLWRLVDPFDIIGSWATQVGTLLAALTGAQTAAAAGAQAYVAAALAAQGADPDPAGVVAAGALAGIAADGRPLDTLLAVPAIDIVALVDGGMPVPQALRSGRERLERIIVSEVTDAARVATGVAQLNDRAARGYVRMVSGGACARCLVLAGKWFAANRGFARHPRCDCTHVPAAEVMEPPDPRDLFDRMSEAEQDRTFTRAGARAIRDGADLNQVVNARRGMKSAGVFGRQALITLEGTTRRGSAGRRLGTAGGFRRVPGERLRRAIPVRLMPEQIYADARRLGYDRERTIRLLKLHGYIV